MLEITPITNTNFRGKAINKVVDFLKSKDAITPLMTMEKLETSGIHFRPYSSLSANTEQKLAQLHKEMAINDIKVRLSAVASAVNDLKSGKMSEDGFKAYMNSLGYSEETIAKFLS